MSRLRIFADDRPDVPLSETRDHAAMAAELAKLGVDFEQWTTTQSIAPGDAPETIIAAYRQMNADAVLAIAAEIAAMPRVDRPTESLEPIPGQVPTLAAMPEGCRFQGRCPLREDACARRPDLTQIAPDHFIRCVVVAREAR